jgi:uncharacterized protein YndB with AHSA1/START domain
VESLLRPRACDALVGARGLYVTACQDGLPPEYGDQYNIWTYRKIAPTERIEYISNLADKDGNKADPVKMGMPPDFPKDQLHTVAFKEEDGKTEMTVTEHNWAVGQMMEMSKAGLEQCLDKMAKIFTKS